MWRTSFNQAGTVALHRNHRCKIRDLSRATVLGDAQRSLGAAVSSRVSQLNISIVAFSRIFRCSVALHLHMCCVRALSRGVAPLATPTDSRVTYEALHGAQ
jgi:hypothetical protein